MTTAPSSAASAPDSLHDPRMRISALVTWLVVGVLGGLQAMPADPQRRWLAAGLYGAFGLLTALGWLPRFTRRVPAWTSLLARALMTLGIALVAGVAFPFMILFFMLAAEAALAYTGWHLVAWLGFLYALTVFGLLQTAPSSVAALAEGALWAAGYGFFASFAAVLREMARARQREKQLLAELQAAHRELQAYTMQAEELAMEQERNRLAQELHSTLGYHLGLAEMHLQALQRWLPREAERDFALALVHVQDSLRDLQRTVQAQGEAVDNLAESLSHLMREFSSALGVPVELDLRADLTTLPRPVRLVLYSAAREGLRNVQQHAHASRVLLQVFAQDGWLHLVLEDDGVGPPDDWHERGLGLAGLSRRLKRWGGQLHLARHAPQGARLTVRVPLETPSRTAGPGAAA